MIYWNADLARRLACSDKDKEALPSLIGELIDEADRARLEGVKALAESLSGTGNPMLAYGLRLISEGLSAEALEDILAIYLSTSQFYGYDFLRQCIQAEALLGIASGDSREMLLRKLAPYCGAERSLKLLESLGGMESDARV